MARVRKTKSSKRELYDFAETADEPEEDADLPKDEAGRRKIKRQYQDLLGIRIEKLKGRILNRERINKTIEGIYFICIKCMKVCHSLDDGLQEDPNNQNNICGKCAQGAHGGGLIVSGGPHNSIGAGLFSWRQPVSIRRGQVVG